MYFQILPIPERKPPFTYTCITAACSLLDRGPGSMLHCCWIAAGCLCSACAPAKPACVALGSSDRTPGGMLRAGLGFHSSRGSETCVRPSLEVWNIMEGLEELWKALGYGAWNILAPIHCMRSVLQVVPVGMTFSTDLFPKRANTYRSMFVQSRNKSQRSSPVSRPDGLLVTVPWRDLHSQADTERH